MCFIWQAAKKTLEQKEEEKLKAKYPNLSKGGPAMLHKRLIQKGVSNGILRCIRQMAVSVWKLKLVVRWLVLAPPLFWF